MVDPENIQKNAAAKTIPFVVFMVKRPCVVIMLTLGLAVLLSGAAIANTYSSGADLIQTPGADADLDHITSINSDSLSLALDMVDGGEDKDDLESGDEELQQTRTSGILLVVFEAAGDNIFSNKAITRAKTIEDKLIKHPDYSKYCKRDIKKAGNDSIPALEQCSPPVSPLNIFYASSWDQTRIDKVIASVKRFDNFASDAEDIENCVRSLSRTQQELLTGLGISVYATKVIPDLPSGMTESSALALVTSLCPFVQADSLLDLSLIYGTLIELYQIALEFDGKGELRDSDRVLEMAATLLQVPTLRPLVDFFFDENFASTNLKSKFTRFLVSYGVPLEGFKNKVDKEDEQDKLFNDWFQAEFRDFLQEENDDESFKTYYFATSLILAEILSIVILDGLNAIGSMAFVYGYLVFQTDSFFLATAGMIEIVMSLPLAYAFYSLIFQFAYLGTFCSMCIYIVLAIGADDIFVFMDAYKQVRSV